ncbi:MAG: hypothetical protein KAT56_01180, partial [Sedimentisphaerales bacterium]|nr:hypothetical protein [Sedimentisphaerales bacterium]
MKKTLVLVIVAGVLLSAADSGNGSIYYVPVSTSIVDGDTFCGGSACTSADTIIIRGGARGSLKFQDFNGAGSYITITNENTNPDSKVEITSNGSGGWGVLSLSNCKYVDLRGDNDSDLAYGIKVINEDVAPKAGTVWVYGESDHIKLSYLEAMGKGTTTTSRIGILVNDSSLSSAWTFNDFEIHHNYIHDTRYSAMYLGPNWAQANDNPYVSTFSIHDNIMEDLGSYGITFKSINGPNNYIYNNTVRVTGLVPIDGGDNFAHGIGVQMTYGDESYVSIYDNWIEKTVGPGLKIGGLNHLVYNNTIVGCGTGNDPKWGHGICTHTYAENVELYDNIIIQAYQYGIYGGWATEGVLHQRNLIGDSGIGETGGTNLTEGTGADANIYHADVADFGFKVWSDDGDYSNDDFSLGGTELADLNEDGKVDLEDFAVFAS